MKAGNCSLWLMVCIASVCQAVEYRYSNGNVAYDGTKVYYSNGAVLMDGSGNIYFEDGTTKFRQAGYKDQFNYPNGNTFQEGPVLMSYPDGTGLYSGLSFDYNNRKMMARAAAATDAYFEYKDGKSARDTSGRLLDRQGRDTEGPVVLYEALEDEPTRQHYGHLLSILRKDSYVLELDATKLFVRARGYVQLMPIRWTGGRPDSWYNSEIYVELGHHDKGLVIKIKDGSTKVLERHLIRQWDILGPSGSVQADFNPGVRHLRACDLLREALLEIKKYPGTAPGSQSFALQGRYGRINVREIFPGYSLQMAKEMMKRAASRITFWSEEN